MLLGELVGLLLQSFIQVRVEIINVLAKNESLECGTIAIRLVRHVIDADFRDVVIIITSDGKLSQMVQFVVEHQGVTDTFVREVVALDKRDVTGIGEGLSQSRKVLEGAVILIQANGRSRDCDLRGRGRRRNVEGLLISSKRDIRYKQKRE